MTAPKSLARLLFLLGGLFFFSYGCEQFNPPKKISENEETRYRAKNVHRYLQDLEEDILQEQYNIKLLQDTLNINLAREQALAEQVKKMEAKNTKTDGDLKALANELKGLEAQLNQQRENRKGLEGNLKAEKEQTAALEKSIAAESSRVGGLRNKLSQAGEESIALEKALAARNAEIAAKKQALEAATEEAPPPPEKK